MDEDKILIIDDEEALARFIEKILSCLGSSENPLTIQVANTGQNGINLARELQPDVVLLDIKLPDISGIDVLAQLKQMDPDVQVVMMTGFASLETAVAAVREGAYDYINKPFDSFTCKSTPNESANNAGINCGLKTATSGFSVQPLSGSKISRGLVNTLRGVNRIFGIETPPISSKNSGAYCTNSSQFLGENKIRSYPLQGLGSSTYGLSGFHIPSIPPFKLPPCMHSLHMITPLLRFFIVAEKLVVNALLYPAFFVYIGVTTVRSISG